MQLSCIFVRIYIRRIHKIVKMEKSHHKILFIFAAVCFALTATNILLALHLAERDEDGHHDHNTCPICQQAVANKTNIILPPVSISLQLPQITIANVNAVECFVKNSPFITPYLRAPPTAA